MVTRGRHASSGASVALAVVLLIGKLEREPWEPRVG